MGNADALIEKVARAICESDELAPAPDAIIMWKMKPAKAWEARKPMAEAAIRAILAEIKR